MSKRNNSIKKNDLLEKTNSIHVCLQITKEDIHLFMFDIFKYMLGCR